MKKLLLISLLLAFTSFGADTDLRKGVDLTGYSTIPTSLFNQLVDNGTIATNKGLIIITNQTPDIITNPRYTNWLWMDTSLVPPQVKAYSGSSWNLFGVGPNSVGSSQIIDGAVINSKIAAGAVTTDKIAANAVTTGNIAVGAVGATNIQGGAINAFQINTNSIDTTKIGAGAINSSNLASGLIVQTNLAANSIAQTNLQANIINQTNIQAGAIISTNILAGAIYGTNLVNNTVGTNQLFQLTTFNSSTNAFSSVTYTYDSGTNISFAAAGATRTLTHGLGSVPKSLRVVIVNCHADTGATGWAIGDEINLEGQPADASNTPFINVWADSTTINIVRQNAHLPVLMIKGTGVPQTINDIANWSLRVYATSYK